MASPLSALHIKASDSCKIQVVIWENMALLWKATKGEHDYLLLGVTGGIASGKTVVAKMLEELGAPLIDFDVLARQVVEPGEPAFTQIVDYFGKEVLQEDGALDRKELSKIVFRDTEKRNRLEGFTHPPIYEAFVIRIKAITKKDPEAIIQAVVPLLIEKNLQPVFDKILVVYVPQEKQIERLVGRDGFSEEEAARMLKAQLPINEKLTYADFVVNNEGTMEETRKQVEEVWQELKRLQR
jgi:dephospho-CoA kinase